MGGREVCLWQWVGWGGFCQGKCQGEIVVGYIVVCLEYVVFYGIGRAYRFGFGQALL